MFRSIIYTDSKNNFRYRGLINQAPTKNIGREFIA